jgi:isoleucyl-tRNA synthetase
VKKENAKFNFVKNEKDMLSYWKKEDVLKKVKERNKGKQKYNFIDGPITANAPMCLHHAWGRTLKDAYNRFNSLMGRDVYYQYGFDAQGMWVEVEVEKLLGLNGKQEIAKYGIANFTEKCIERVNFFKNMQTEQSKILLQLGDWENSYITNSDKNIETIWHFLKVCNDKGMLKQSYKSMPWCPRCGTSLSEHEMSGSYKERTHKAVFVKAKLTNGERIIVWTTTPWTLSANVAIAVHPKLNYGLCKIKSDKSLVYVCESALKILGDDLTEVVKLVSGAELCGREYEPFLKLKKQNFTHRIITWEEVGADDGSGAVHIAPGCGAEDFELGKKLGLTPIIPVNEAGEFENDFEWLAGYNTANCEEVIFNNLKENDTYYKVHSHTHNYPFCWRCKTDVIFRLVAGWDIATDGIRHALLKANKTVNWEPEFMEKAMTQWLTDMGDWNISRRRFYGLPLPFYPCSCGHLTIIGSKKELAEKAADKTKLQKIPHLHRPYIDEVEIKCGKCGKNVKRITEVGDCWLDAGIVPFSTREEFTPADLVLEMKEQVRLWFYSQLFMSVVLKGAAPYKRVVGHSTMLDEDGKKFSKTGPKKISIEDAVSKHGADILRWTFASSNPGLDMRFGGNMAEESQRKLLSIWNAYVFYNTYAVIDKPDVKNYTPQNLGLTDIWLIQITNKYITNTKKEYEDFKAHNVVKLTEDFAENITNFYIRVNRRRFWRGENDTDKLNAYWCLYNALHTICIAISPIVPAFAEYMWQAMDEAGLIMLTEFPTEIKIAESTKDVCGSIALVKNIISLGLTLRAEQQIAVKQPLNKLYVKTDKKLEAEFYEIIKEQVNVKEVEIVKSDNKFNTPYLIIDFKKAGAVLKNEVQVLKTVLGGLDSSEMAAAVTEYDKALPINIGRFKGLSRDLFERKLAPKTGFVITAGSGITVVLDTVRNSELIDEGISREIIRAFQVLRSESGLDIQDKITINIHTASEQIIKAVKSHEKRIMNEILATEIHFKMPCKGSKTLVINESEVTIDLAKVK